MHPHFLRETSDTICVPLTIILNKSLTSGILPNTWKCANITPIHKKGAKNLPANYRPISLTTVIGKILESIVRDKLVDHCMLYNLFSDAQHGFVPGRSCMTQLLTVMEDWTLALDNSHSIDSVYLDFQKAFDTVPHQRLLHKLSAYGVGRSLRDWLQNFLTERSQCVVLNGMTSTSIAVKSGIPQGSVLGPILFVLYINDLPRTCIRSIVKIFADDTKIYRSVDDEAGRNILQQDLDTLNNWSETWQLKFNKSKCKVIHFGNNNEQFNYTMGDHPLISDNYEKDLGIIIDNDLKFHEHTVYRLQLRKHKQIWV